MSAVSFLAIQALGLVYQWKLRRSPTQAQPDTGEEEIIDL